MSAVITSLNDGIYEIILNRPKQLNALNWEMLEQLNEAANTAEENPQVRCVVIKGEGAHFMAGGDIVYFYELRDLDEKARSDEFNRLVSTVHVFVEKMAALPVPVISSVRGAAAGFGISLVAGSDLTIATRNSFYTSAYNILGTSPDGGSTYYLPRSVGIKKAMEITLLTKRYSVDEALDMGLVNMVVEDDNLESETEKAARTIARSSRTAVANAKRLIRQSFQHNLEVQLHSELDSFLQCAATRDFSEGVQAFIEKRKPNFDI